MPDSTSSPTAGPTSSPRQSRRTIPPLVLLSFAVLHSQVYWLYSVIYHLCNNISERPLDLSMDETVLTALTKRSGRARAFSEPQQTSSVYLQQSQIVTLGTSSAVTSTKNRPRSRTITASTVQADTPLRRQQWVEKVHALYIHEEQNRALNTTDHPLETRLLRSTILDERLGRTQPPRWWQRTKRHLTRQDNNQEDETIFNNLTSTISLPEHSSMDSDMRTNQNTSIHLPRSVSPQLPHTSCDRPIQQHHDDITTNTTDNNPMDSLSAQVTIHQPRSLAKIRSVFKSQIEPETTDTEEPKRQSILGIPSRWLTPPRSDQVPKKRLFVPLRRRKHAN